MKYFFIGLAVGYATHDVLIKLLVWVWQAFGRWNKNRKQLRYERDQRRKGMAFRKSK